MQKNTIASPSAKRVSTKRLTIAAMFAAIAALLMYLEVPLPLIPPFLRIDFSGAVCLIAAFVLGPFPAFLITLVKNMVHLLSSQTGGVGELGDLLMLSALFLSAWAITRIPFAAHKKWRMPLAYVTGVTAMTAIGCLVNWFLLIPFYSKIMPIDAIINMCAEINPNIDSLTGYIIWGVIPFNLIKGVLLCLLTALLWKKISFLFSKYLPDAQTKAHIVLK